MISQHGEIYSREFGFSVDMEIGVARKMVAILESNDPLNQLWIAEDESGKRAGSIAVSRLGKAEEGRAFINFVLVVDEFRGSGLARRLMDTVHQHCREQRVRRITLETYTVLQSARRLYDSLGYRILEQNEVQRFGLKLRQEIWFYDLV